MSWRPEGWNTEKQLDKALPYTCTDPNVIEAYDEGADAMLESLFWMAQKSPTGVFTIDSKEVHIYFEDSKCV